MQIRHALEGHFVSVGDRLATSKAAHCMRQNIQFAEARHNLIHQDLGAVESRNFRGQRREVWVIEIRLLYLPRCANDGRTGIEKRLCHISSEAAVCSGYEYDPSFHRVLRSQWPSDSDAPKRLHVHVYGDWKFVTSHRDRISPACGGRLRLQ